MLYKVEGYSHLSEQKVEQLFKTYEEAKAAAKLWQATREDLTIVILLIKSIDSAEQYAGLLKKEIEQSFESDEHLFGVH